MSDENLVDRIATWLRQLADALEPNESSSSVPQPVLEALGGVLGSLDSKRAHVRVVPVEVGDALGQLEEADEERRPVTVPDLPGPIYAIEVDLVPGDRFAHPVVHGWLHPSTGAQWLRKASWPLRVLPRSGPALPFTPVAATHLGGTSIVLGSGHFAAPNAGSWLSSWPEDLMTIIESMPPVGVRAPTPACIRRALVCDLGDSHRKTLADEMAEDCDGMGKWLARKGFSVERRSQYRSSRHPALATALMPAALLARLQHYAAEFAAAPASGCCHQFFFYLSAHGSTRGLSMYAPDGRRNERISYQAILEALCAFPSNTVITVMVDACSSGALVERFQSGSFTPAGAAAPTRFTDHAQSVWGGSCGFTILTVCAANETAPGGESWWHDSQTERFLKAGDVDLDRDRVKGDLRDRFGHMQSDNTDLHPQSVHVGPDWGVLD